MMHSTSVPHAQSAENCCVLGKWVGQFWMDDGDMTECWGDTDLAYMPAYMYTADMCLCSA